MSQATDDTRSGLAFHIRDLPPDSEPYIHEAAMLLVEGFREGWPEAWPTLDDALDEVREALEPGRIARMAVDDAGQLLGWIGAISEYRGRAWELHPLVVRPEAQGRGIGRALVEDLEAQLRPRGCITLFAGSDDETGMTTLSGIDLYPDVWTHIAHIQNLRGHPYTFYQKVGFVITGVLPDANGPGKPDILLAKRIKAE